MLRRKDTERMIKEALMAFPLIGRARAIRVMILREAKRWLHRLAFLIAPSVELVMIVIIYTYILTLVFVLSKR